MWLSPNHFSSNLHMLFCSERLDNTWTSIIALQIPEPLLHLVREASLNFSKDIFVDRSGSLTISDEVYDRPKKVYWPYDYLPTI